MLKRSEGYFRGKDDFELFFQTWTSSKPTATLVITHGMGEHTECYQRLIDGLQDQNLRFIAWDLRGHGRSEGKRGVISDFNDFCDDLTVLLSHIKKDISEDPIVLLGHSMGGLVTLKTLAEHHPDVKCAVLSSPLMGVAVDVPEVKKVGARYLAQYLPTVTMWNEINDRDLTHDKEVIAEFRKDPLRHDRVSPKLYLEMVANCESIKENADQIDLPIFFQLSGQDKIVSTQATLDFFDMVKSNQKEYKIYENSYHEIYNDIERDLAFNDIKVFLKKHL